MLTTAGITIALTLVLGATRSTVNEIGPGALLVGSGSSTDPVGAAPMVPTPARPPAFTISGSVGGLFPGASTTLPLTVTNAQRFAITVTSITTSVANASAGCNAANLTVGAFSGTVTVPARGSWVVTVPVTLGHQAPDACQGAVFPLRYTGQARMA